MTTFSDNVYSGSQALTSALSSQSEVSLSRTFRFTGGGAQTQTFVFPTGVQNLNASCYIIQDGSAATTDTITVSAAGTDFITFSSMGSAAGLVETTLAGLGTKTVVASAASNLSTTAEVSAAITLNSVDTATDYQVQLRFNRLRQAQTT
jgi:NADH:ubiquinone oxidoreductase subunit F (NADH-binding)